MGCVDCGGDNNWDGCDALEIKEGIPADQLKKSGEKRRLTFADFAAFRFFDRLDLDSEISSGFLL